MFRKLYLGLSVSMLLVGCGGGGSSNNNDDDMEMVGDNCVTFPRVTTDTPPTTSRFVDFTNDPDRLLPSEFEGIQSIVFASDTTETFNLKADGIIDQDITIDFTIANNYRDDTRLEILLDGTVTEAIFTPYRRFAVDRVCENQTWTNTFNSEVTIRNTAIGDLPSDTETLTWVQTIEKVNVNRTVEAGTYTTFIQRTDSGDVVSRAWIDQDSGIVVYSESRDFVGTLRETQELIDF